MIYLWPRRTQFEFSKKEFAFEFDQTNQSSCFRVLFFQSGWVQHQFKFCGQYAKFSDLKASQWFEVELFCQNFCLHYTMMISQSLSFSW